MDSSLTSANSASDPVEIEAKTRSLRQVLLYGGAMLGLAVGLERVLAFLSTMLAARLSGPSTFGAYSVVLATAGTIAAYAGAGIGSTAVRFSGDYPQDSEGYHGLVRVLMIISVLSAAAAALLMFAGAVPLARWVLRNEELTVVLRVAALSAGAMVLLECCRGLLLGQQKFRSLLVLSAVAGLGMIVVLPLTARVSAVAMIAGQGCIALIAALICVLFSRRLGLKPIQARADAPGPGVGTVFKFGVVQFSAFAGISIATWCVASLIARSDPSLTQMGFYAVSNQFRGFAVIAPGLLAQVVYSSLTNKSGASYGGAQRVLLTSSIMTTLLATLAAGFVMVVLPWLLSTAYGRAFGPAEIPVLLLLATAIIHMADQAGAQRLSIVRLKAVGAINALWAVLLIAFGLLMIPIAGATGAALAFLLAHAISHVLVTVCLCREDGIATGYVMLAAISMVSAFLLSAIGYARAVNILHPASLTFWMALVWVVSLLALIFIGIKNGCFPQLSIRKKAQSQTVPSLSET